MHEIINQNIIDKFKNNTFEGFKNIFLNVGIKFEHEKDLEIYKENGSLRSILNIKLLKNVNDITFLYMETEEIKFTQIFFKEFIKEENYGKDIGKGTNYLIFLVKKGEEVFIYGIDILNKTKIKISNFNIDIDGFEDYKNANERIYKNRTLNEQLNYLSSKLYGGKKHIKRRYIIEFFEKKKLTEDFYQIYKKDIFEKIKKQNKSILNNENELNQFTLVNLNRLLFIHFLDKKGGIFNYDKKYGSFIAYLRYKKYKNNNFSGNFYNSILKTLFFDIFNTSKDERHIDKLQSLHIKEDFYELPYLNGGLFKKHSFDNANAGFDIGDDIIDDFIEKIIDGFNFTIQEDTPLEVNLSVDPELLGYIFENLIQEYDNKEDERSKGGIFYTPKIEVDFMVRQSIVEYLTKQGLNKQDLYKLIYRESGDDTQQKHGDFNENEIYKILTNIYNLKIVDPTCGSGAFLVGAMQTIIDIEDTIKIYHNRMYQKLIRKNLISEYKLFERKKELIKNTLYGVDIKNWAVEIAKMRLWLSMILDVESDYFIDETAKQKPLLPSFSFKILTGDSLVNKIGDELIPIDFLESNDIELSLKHKINKLIQLKNDYYDNKSIDDAIILEEEKKVYKDILENKIKNYKKQIIKIQEDLDKNHTDLFGEVQSYLSSEARAKLKKELTKYRQLLEQNQNVYHQIEVKNNLPFAWSIDFAEVFVQKGGFDLLIGNPPYVPHKKISDPNNIINNDNDYKKTLKQTIDNDYFDYVKKNFNLNIKVSLVSDLYIYFYFRGLKLINEKGIFSFITSNSWLDVDFGSSLQEFLLRFVDNIHIYDNSAEKSFEHADVNTIIAIFDKPRFYKKDLKYRKLRDLEEDYGNTKLINFTKPFKDVVFSSNFIEIDNLDNQAVVEDKQIHTKDINFRKKSNQDFRVVYIDNKNLFIDGAEKKEITFGEHYIYQGNKWGSKYLRANNIFFQILNKGGKKLKKIGKIHFIKILTGLKKGGFKSYIMDKSKKLDHEYGIPLLKNVKLHKKILIKDYDSYVIDKKIASKNLKTADLLWLSGRGSTHKCFLNTKMYAFSGNFIGLNFNNSLKETFSFILNSTLIIYLSEIYSRSKGIGGGASVMNKSDLLKTEILYEVNNINNFTQKEKFLNREIKSIFEELGFDKNKTIREQEPNPLPDRKELDDIIFDEIGLTEEERKEVYRSLAELVKQRLDKAKSK